MQKHIPVGGEARPVLVEDVAELVALVLGEHVLERGAMVQEEYRVGTYELLDQQRGGRDFAR